MSSPCFARREKAPGSYLRCPIRGFSPECRYNRKIPICF